jgi:hypothetical protein
MTGGENKMENNRTKYTIRLSPECKAALDEVESQGLNKSKFIRDAIINYHSSGSWRYPSSPDRVEDAVKFEKENKASDNVSDRMSDESDVDVFQAESFDEDERTGKPAPQMPPPYLSYPYANPHSISRKGMGTLESIFILIVGAVIAVLLYFALKKKY